MQVPPAPNRNHRRRAPLCAVALIVALAVPALASAHLERPSYWPDPTPDRSISPPAGGEVPKARPLASAVTGEGPGEVRVVCEGGDGSTSLDLARRSIRRAERRGFRLRPSQPRKLYSSEQAREMLAINRALAARCAFKSVQTAINRSHNNDRVVIMPGRYTEPKSRRAPTNDPRCNPELLQQDQTADQNGDPANTPSYEYQATCPNDQNLIYVQGRAIKGDPLESPRADRHGIPEQELGRCVRCNLQVEGSGPRPEDVILDAGKVYRNPVRPGARPGASQPDCDLVDDVSPCYAKHVVMRTDRSDGFVARNLLLRGALEHGFYTEETDGVLLDRVKFFWNADYGHLSFTTDHNVVKNCEGYGSGDAVVYPGAAPQTGDFRDESFYPEQRFNTVVKRCDLHGSVMGYSGSMGNSVRITRNDIYGNTNGITSDTLSAPGHPGFPADGLQIDHNRIYSNNLNLYVEDPPVEPYYQMPIGTGIVWVGMNDGEVFENRIFDNWRHGAVLTAVPDEITGGPDGNVDPAIHCAVTIVASTSCGNRYHDNVMGPVPPGFEFPPRSALLKFGNVSGADDGQLLPNGVDFWWDEFPGNDGNCWYDNTGSDGTEGSITAGTGTPPDPLPGDCATSVGNGDPVKEAQLVDCATWAPGQTAEDHPLCYWLQMPEQPESSAARVQNREWLGSAREYVRSPEGKVLRSRLDEIAAQSDFASRHR